MAVQTSYAANIRQALLGMVADQQPPTIITRTIEDVAGIGFGRAAFQGANQRGVTATPSNLFRGITIRDVSLPVGAEDVYPQGAEVALQTRGTIWVTALVAVAASDPVYVTPAGGFTNVAGAGANFLIPDAMFDSNAAIGALVIVRLAN